MQAVIIYFPHGFTYSRAPLGAPGVTAGSCPAPADWSTVQQLWIYPKDNPLWSYNHTFAAFITPVSHPTLRNIMQLTHFSHKSSIFSISADQAVNWARLPSEGMLYTPHSKSLKPREFKSFCPLLTFGLTLRSLAHLQEKKKKKKERWQEGRSLQFQESALERRKNKNTCTHATPVLEDGEKTLTPPPKTHHAARITSFLPCVECADTPMCQTLRSRCTSPKPDFRPTVS